MTLDLMSTVTSSLNRGLSMTAQDTHLQLLVSSLKLVKYLYLKSSGV